MRSQLLSTVLCVLVSAGSAWGQQPSSCASFDALRMGLGFDLTLLLALANLALFAAWCAGLRRVLDAPDDGPGAAYRPPEAVA